MLIMGVGYFFVDQMGQPESLLPLIRPYYLVILASMPFVMLFNVLRQLSDGTMHTKTAMWALWAGNALNILGNWLLIYGVGPFPELGLFRCRLVDAAFAYFYRSMDLSSPTLRALLQALPQRFL